MEETKPKESFYTTKIAPIQYEIKGDKPEMSKMVDSKKAEELLKEIQESSVSPEDKKFLAMAAWRHCVFNFSQVAEYYAHADAEVQKLMEKSALVIIDLDDAIENGYVMLSKRLDEIRHAEKTSADAIKAAEEAAKGE